jgi:murein DD-endopeptidase MepM/ murein hydrolase activator NlpD
LPRKPIVIAVTALCMLVGLAADLGWRAYTRPRYAVEVDGTLVGALRQPEIAQQAVGTILAELPEAMRAEVKLPEKIVVRELKTSERRVATASSVDIERALVQTMPSLAMAAAITVNGTDVVAVADVEQAKRVKEQMLEEYRTTVLDDATDVEQLAFEETIDWHTKVVPSERVRTPEEAITILKHGTDRLATYEVKSGDTGWDIARSYNVSTDQLSQANPSVDVASLQIGQVLNVTFREPYVHTQSVSKKVVQEAIPFTEEVQTDSSLWPWQYVVVTPGVPGTRELTLREYRENGRVVKTEVVANKVFKQPKVQSARRGTKQIPDMGTGTLVFPAVGVITSEFGPRWGSYHYGIDIGASTGTAVLAADSGMVTFRGWDGNYGYVVHLDHGGGRMETWYAHLSAFNVSLGDSVKQGQVIGYVGSTGYSTGPHLHYEVHEDGEAVNPLSFYQ